MTAVVVLVAALLLAGCGRGDAVVQASVDSAAAHEASLIPVAGGLAVAWYDTRDGHGEIYLRRLDARGRPLGPERQLTKGAGDSLEVDLQQAGNNLVVAWYEKSAGGTLRPKMGSWTAEGEQRWLTTVAATGRNVIIRVHGNRVFAAWIVDENGDSASVWGGWWHLDGRPDVPAARLATAGRTTWNLNGAIDADGRPWVVFDARAGTKKEELFLATIGDGGARVVPLTADDGFASKYPDIALSHGRAALTWFDERDGNQEVYLAVSAADALTTGVEQRARRVTRTPGDSFGAYVAWNGDRVGLAWSDASAGQAEIFFAGFDAQGAPAGSAVRLTHTAAASLVPCIRAWQDGFALAWNETEPAPADGHGGGPGRSVIDVALTR